ncbi:amidase [Rhodococcus jostii]|uniref:amidase n=1 Tax=Rhodococcus jostii TaxID=132919 RepID=A0A1H4TJR5_RHOJO|nr:amidase [Rhodococcus jostii]SEC56692.1 aspartyl-tRNA(Asn)/glutamyl-tRNA(Gln) amidotransferase subunit A [Rhodococcus jostii]
MTVNNDSPSTFAHGFFTTQSIGALGSQLRNGQTTSLELVDHALAEIERANPVLNAFSSIDADGARRTAEHADTELARGIDRGPLHGIPIAIKDIIDVAGQVTTAGSALYLDRYADKDAACVRALREAGAIIVGKTVLHEFAYGATCDRSVHGASRNPHDPSRISGGSSGGSAVAVAAGMVPMALGTDTAGSVRVPAALCGIVGFKPAFDAISTDGVYPLSPSLDHVGIFTQTVADAALTYQALAASDGGASTAAAADDSTLPEVRVAWVEPSSIGPVDPAVETAVRTAVTDLLGPIPSINLDYSSGDLFSVFSTIQGSEAFAEHVDDVTHAADAIDTEVLGRLQRGAELRAWEYLHAVTARTAFREALEEYFHQYDVLALPTVPTVAVHVGERTHSIDGVEVEIRSALLSLTSPWNLTGSPSITLPAGFVDDLPIGLQLVCATGHEDTLFRLVTRLEGDLAESDPSIAAISLPT